MKRPATARTRRAAVTLGEHLTVWRKLLGLTAEQVSQRAGVSRSTLRRLEHGDLGVNLETYLEVLRVLGQLDRAVTNLDPYGSDLGRAQADRQLPQRVRR
jgi:transcriptional regulator with XRE-family HTH domain